MVEWREEGVLLSARPHGEGGAIVELFTRDHGRHAGMVRGGGGRRMGPVLQPGAQLDATWKARLEAHLGSFTVELVRGRAAEVLSDRIALAGLSAVCAMLGFCLGEREPHPALYDRSVALLDALGAPGWAGVYLGWELALLEELGFGLDLGTCAVTGMSEGLTYISPRTGRAVSREGAGDWVDRLLPFPNSLRHPGPADGGADLLDGLRVTGHFLEAHLAPSLGARAVPGARARFVDALAARANSGPFKG